MPAPTACFAHVDCNNFYASCEKLFRPDLSERPLIVLSNNDGCIVARSLEAKQLGIGMAVPLHKFKGMIQQHRVKVCSSNYALYADMSARFMSILEQLTPSVEVYSIDEAFADLTGIDDCHKLADFGQLIRQTIYQWTGLSVSVGIGPTKTLAKLANWAAKHYPNTDGVVDLCPSVYRRQLLAETPVREVWGIGRSLTERLMMMDIKTAADLANAPLKSLRKRFSVTLERTMIELNGISCIELEADPERKKMILSSRSFGQKLTDFHQIRLAVAYHVTRACEKLRADKSLASTVTLSLRTNPFSGRDSQYRRSATGQLPQPSNDTSRILRLANELLANIWKPNYLYHKAGVMLHDLSDESYFQNPFFESSFAEQHQQSQLMRTIDDLNKRFGRIVFLGRSLESHQSLWRMNRRLLSPAYTTQWEQLPVAKLC